VIEIAKQQLKKLMDRVDEFSLRERGLIFVGILVVLYLLATNLVFAPLRAEQVRLEGQFKNKRDQVLSLEKQIQVILTGGVADSDPEKRARLASLKEQTIALDTTLAKTTSGLVTPKEMARLVEQILAKNRQLRVIKVESLPAAPLLDDGGKPGAGAAASPGAATPDALIYKHGMQIELTGGYLDILNYLKALEGLPWKVFWGQVTLQTEKHPVSRLTLVIYTLSTHQGWIAI
jgi:MSHA biogenesis protein MshJ